MKKLYRRKYNIQQKWKILEYSNKLSTNLSKIFHNFIGNGVDNMIIYIRHNFFQGNKPIDKMLSSFIFLFTIIGTYYYISVTSIIHNVFSNIIYYMSTYSNRQMRYTTRQWRIHMIDGGGVLLIHTPNLKKLSRFQISIIKG